LPPPAAVYVHIRSLKFHLNRYFLSVFEMGGGHYCALFGCNSSRYQLGRWKGEKCSIHQDKNHEDCPCLPPYKLFQFPASEEGKREWCSRIYRKNNAIYKLALLLQWPHRRERREGVCSGGSRKSLYFHLSLV
jgi:hypothetical protein